MQQQPTYDWKRFWYPQGSQILTDNRGYLIDPTSEWSKYAPTKLVEIEKLADIPCLVLLGEPGIGKTKTIERYVAHKAKDKPEQLLHLNLNSHGSEDRLIRKLFESPKFQSWIRGNQNLEIVLDSLDDCLLRISNVMALLIDEFSQYKENANRLFLRIACRTAVWQPEFESELRGIWGQDSVKVYELAPLHQAAVKYAGQRQGIENPDAFLQAIWDKQLVSLARKPITLNVLLGKYLKDGSFFKENTLFSIYFEGCQILCDEELQSDLRNPRRKENLDLEYRFIIAARIAFVTMFARRDAIWVGAACKKDCIEDLDFRELSSGYEKANEHNFPVDEAAIDEVLGTGLFVGYGSQRIGWAHRTYAEFLAAWYLVEREIPLKQLKTLFLSPEDPDHRLIPQLHETAAWLSSMREDFRELITRTDPNVVLRSDIPTDANIRASIVASLLKQYESRKIFDRGGDKYRFYEKLKHPEIGKQLRPYLYDQSKQIDARSLAIDIVEVCQVAELEDELVDIALDSSQPIDLRVDAARVITSIGSIDTKRKLEPLATEPLPEDKDDYLKGYALQATWQTGDLSVEELFQSLTPQQEILKFEIAQNLQISDLPYALDWLKQQGARHFSHPFAGLGDNLLFRAWQHFEVPEIQDGFTEVALTQWRKHQSIIICNTELEDEFESLLSKEPQKRRLLLAKAVLLMAKAGDNSNLITITPPDKILSTKDFFYALKNLKSSEDEKVQKIWANLIQHCFNSCELEQQELKKIDAIIQTTESNQILHNLFKARLDDIELDSDEARELKANYMNRQSIKQATKNKLLDPLPKEEVIRYLGKFEAGDTSAWWHLTRELTLTPTSSRRYRNYEPTRHH
ncbi:MAG: TniB family NTP-binding protein [Cyanobacteria bacterium P01_F01_bin.13]